MATDLSGRVVGNYRIVEKIGEGGMGTVYRAVDLMLGREVALKAIRPALAEEPESVQRFHAEARLAARIIHPAIATIFGFFAEGEQLFLAMELVRGESLAQRLKRCGALPWPEAVAILAAALEGVAVAHRAGIVHRDLKPDNLMVTEEGGIKVMDFGIARAVEGTRLTRTGLLVGTLAYMAPEQIRGEEVDHRTDLYSLGIVLYQALTGRPPFEGGSDFAILKAQIDEEPKPPGTLVPGLPIWLERSVLRVLAKDPAQRFQSAEEMRQVLLAGAVVATVELPATELRPSPTAVPLPPPLPMSTPSPAGISVAAPAFLATPPPAPPAPPAEAATHPVAGIGLPTHTTRSPVFRPATGARLSGPLLAAVVAVCALLGGFLAWRLLQPPNRPEEQAAAMDPQGVLPSETFLESAKEGSKARPATVTEKPAAKEPAQQTDPAVATIIPALPVQTELAEPPTNLDVADPTGLAVVIPPGEPEEPADAAPEVEGELRGLGRELIDHSARLYSTYTTYLEQKEEEGHELTPEDEALRDEIAEFEELVEEFASAQRAGWRTRMQRRGEDPQRVRRRIAETLGPVRASGERIDRLIASVAPSAEVVQLWREIRQKARRATRIVGP